MFMRGDHTGPPTDSQLAARYADMPSIRFAYAEARASDARQVGTLGPDVGHRVLGVGDDQRPAVVGHHLDPVDQDELRSVLAELLHQGPHDQALLLEGRRNLQVDDGHRRRGVDDLGQGGRAPRQQGDQADQRGRRVEGGEEGREHVAAAAVRGERHATGRGDLEQSRR